MADATPTTKLCPGVTGKIKPHQADLATKFAKNSARPDGLARVCRDCWKVYEADRKVAKAAEAGGAPKAPKAPRAVKPGKAAKIITTDDTAADEHATKAYHDKAAVAAANGETPGWGTSTVSGVIYARPEGDAEVESEAGQAALGVIADAVRKADRERKAQARADAKAAAGKSAADAAAQGTPGPKAVSDLMRLTD